MHFKGPEPRQCPSEFQDRITRMFGVNQFGDPYFKIVWGQTEKIRLGNRWSNGRISYRDRSLCNDMPCWVILRWKPPSFYGSPAAYYANSWMSTGKRQDVRIIPKKMRNERTGARFEGFEVKVDEHDEAEGFYVTGEYPWKGRYEIVQPLIDKQWIDGELKITHFPLSHLMIDLIIPLILAYQELTLEEREAARVAAKAEEERKLTEEIADRLADSMPAYIDAVSYSRQGIRTSLLQRKMDAIEAAWKRICGGEGQMPHFRPGFSVGAPQVAHK